MIFMTLPVQDQLALLDPDAYEYYNNSSWNLTVPPGETWYAINIWWATLNGATWFFHRTLNCLDPFVMPAGTNICQPPTNPAFAYICRPAKVAVPANPEAVLAKRLMALRTMPLYTAKAEVEKGSPVGHIVGAYWEKDYPATFKKGLMRHCSNHDSAWTIVVGHAPTGMIDAMNTLTEISDTHTNRVTGNILCPFNTDLWTGLWVQGASFSGNRADTAEHGIGVITYNKLPGDW